MCLTGNRLQVSTVDGMGHFVGYLNIQYKLVLNGHMWFLNIRTEECACSLQQRFCFCFVQILYTSEQIKLINSFLHPFLKFFLTHKEEMTVYFTP